MATQRLEAVLRHIAVASTVAILGVSPAFAHPDEPVVEATLRLEPGDVVSFPVAVHFHRLVATYRIDPPGASGLSLLVADGAAADGPVSFTAAIEGEGSLHHLISCCLGVGFSDMRVSVRHDGEAPVSLDLRAWIVHDEFAVVTHRAEAGALEVPLVMFLALGVMAIGTARGGGRRRVERADPVAVRRGAAASGWSLGLFVAAVAVAATLSAAGAIRYGAGPVDGLIAIMADLPVPGGPFGSRGATVMGLLLLAWVASIALWIRAAGLAGSERRPRLVVLGAALAVVSLATGLAMGWTYDRWSVPVGLGLVLALPLVVASTALAKASLPRPGG